MSSDDFVDYRAEIDAMKAVADALDGLPGDSVRRVLSWAIGAFDAGAPLPTQSMSPKAQKESAGEAVDLGQDLGTDINELADLYYAVDPDTDSMKALVGTYWLTKYEGQPDVDAQSVNKLLKDLGFGVTNITRAFYGLVKSKPQLVLQTRKAGTTKQARKKYKMTKQGEQEIEKHLG